MSQVYLTPWSLLTCLLSSRKVRDTNGQKIHSTFVTAAAASFGMLLDDIAIGSYKINLDHLVFQRQKDLDSDNNAHLVGMSFLKAKGQVEMQRRMHRRMQRRIQRRTS